MYKSPLARPCQRHAPTFSPLFSLSPDRLTATEPPCHNSSSWSKTIAPAYSYLLYARLCLHPTGQTVNRAATPSFVALISRTSLLSSLSVLVTFAGWHRLVLTTRSVPVILRLARVLAPLRLSLVQPRSFHGHLVSRDRELISFLLYPFPNSLIRHSGLLPYSTVVDIVTLDFGSAKASLSLMAST